MVEQLTKTMEGLKSKYESALSTVNALTETVDDQEQALKTQKDKYRSLRNRKERKEAKMQQSLDAADEKIEMEETELSSTKLDLKRLERSEQDVEREDGSSGDGEPKRRRLTVNRVLQNREGRNSSQFGSIERETSEHDRS